MRPTPTLDRVLAVLGVLLGIPAILGFFSQRFGEGLLLTGLVLLIVGYLLYRRYEESQPLFTYLEMHKILKFHDAAATTAGFSTIVTARANHTGVSQLWFRNINADGDVTNFRIDGAPVPQNLIVKKAGSYEVCKQFDRPLRRGDTEQITLSYDLINAFSSTHEGITHVTVTKTKKLKIRVEFHSQRVGHNVRFYAAYGGGIEKDLDPPRFDNTGLALEIELEGLKTAAYYTIDWNW